MKGEPKNLRREGSALLIILAFVTLITVLVVSLLLTAKFERTAASLALGRSQAEVLADYTADSVMGKMTEAIKSGSLTGKSWASEPGRLWIFNIASGTGEITRSSVDLFSGLPGADDAQMPELNSVNLNKASLSGKFPVTGSRGGTMKVGWKNVLKDPSQPASKANPITGRVAYWVDDESCKVNINTADGTQRAATPASMASTGKYSYGFGTPSEIALGVLPGVTPAMAEIIAASTWAREFNSVNELTRTPSAGINQSMVEDLRFDITHFNSSPDLNFMGEPRLSLIKIIAAIGSVPRQTLLLGALGQTQSQNGVSSQPSYGDTLDHIYPQPSQLMLPSYLPAEKMFLHAISTTSQKINDSGVIPDDYYFGKVITSFLNGVNLKGLNFTWPKFDGAGNQGFSGKYTPRQLDAIALQIMDVTGKVAFCDQQRPYSLPGIMEKGWLSNDTVQGVGRAPRLTELLVEASSTIGDPLGYGAKKGLPGYSYPLVRVKIYSEYHYPKGFAGVPNNAPYDSATGQWRIYMGNNSVAGSAYNYYDLPSNDGVKPIGSGKLGTAWMDVLLTALDQSGNPAGIDFTGMSSLWNDSDQAKAALYHPYARLFDNTAPLAGPPVWKESDPAIYTGGIYQAPDTGARTWGMLESLNALGGTVASVPGVYISRQNRYATTDHPARPDATSIRLIGGLHAWIRQESGGSGYRLPHFAPFRSIFPEMQGIAPASMLSELKESVIPIDITIPIPSAPVTMLARVADPMVNQFPGDWEIVNNPPASAITMKLQTNGNPQAYMKGGTSNLDPYFPLDASVTFLPTSDDGDNPGMRPSGGGDPLSIWLPNQDIRIPKQARFPSVGALFSIRTGVFPDITVQALPYLQQHGVPWRALNMSPSTQPSQRTSGGTSYPDWAMLDLFTVPFLPQKPYLNGSTPQAYRRLTQGGATVGRININNPVTPYPFDQGGVNNNPPKRNALDALFYGLKPSKTYDASGNPVYTTIDAATSASISLSVTTYQNANGPFMLAGEIANVPAVAAYLYTGVAAGSISRNDVVRDTVGAITTRSNVYSIWVVTQSVQKRNTNTNYGEFESGDIVTADVRRRYLVERYLETGKDGLPGNATNSSLNTFTVARPTGEVVNAAYHPALSYPLAYRWRIVEMENMRL